MTAETAASFGALLKNARLAAGLTQETLAERSGVSARTIQSLERGESQPHRDTSERLAAALGLAASERARFLAMVSRRPRQRTPRAGATELLAAAARHNLPAQLTSFIGREREREQVVALLRQHRLVTLVGTGGVGKTRLALAVAEELLETYPDGAYWVELAGLREAALVGGAVAAAAGLREEPHRPLLATLMEQLNGKRLLLVLDNCEHLLEACAELVGALLRGLPGVQVLATSREGLQLSAERRYLVPSLTVPDPRRLPAVELVGSYEAVRLFVARAEARQRNFVLDERNGPTVARICARLDGIPLALELAAARTSSLAVEVIAERLDDRFRLLTGGPRDVPPRQQTLQATLDWSYDLLSASERTMLARLAVFVGGWTLAAAEAVCSGAGIEEEAVLDLLGGLVDKSLVQRDESGARYGLLETVRQYAWERLQAARVDPGDARRGSAHHVERAMRAVESRRDEAGYRTGAAVQAQHLAWCVALAEEAEPQLTGAQQGEWLARLAAEHDNLRAALEWSIRGAGDRTMGLQLAGALWRFWFAHGHLSEGRRWLDGALAIDDTTGRPAALRARALHGAGNLAYVQGDYGRAWALHKESLTLQRDLGNTRGSALALNSLGNVAFNQGEYERAWVFYEESLTLQRALGDQWGIANVLNNLGCVAWSRGDYSQAWALQEESLALRRALGDKQGTATALANLGNVAWSQGDYQRAWTLHEESLALSRDLGAKWGIAASLGHLGNVAYSQGEYERARMLHGESLTLFQELGDKQRIAEALGGLARLAAAQGQPERGARLYGAAAAVREGIGSPLPPTEQAEYEQANSALRAALGEAAFAAAWAAGHALPLEQAIAVALEAGRSTRGS